MKLSRRSLLLGVSLIALLTAAQDVFAAAHGCVVGPQRRRTNLNLSWGEAYRQQQYINNMWNSQRPATDGATVTSFLSWDADSYPGPGQTQRFLAWLCPDVGSTTMVAKWIGRGSINLSSMTLVNAPTTVANYRGAGSTIFNGSGGTNYNGSEILNGRVTFTSTLAASVISNCTVVQGSSNPLLTQFVICRLDEEALWDAGQNIRPFFSNLIKAFNPGSLRMMDIAGVNGEQTQITQWSDRSPVGGFSYNESTLLKNKTVGDNGSGQGAITGTNTYTTAAYPGQPNPSTYVDGELFQGYIVNASTGTATINVGGRGAKTLVDSNLSAIASGVLTANTWYTFFYDSMLDVVISRLGFLQGGVPIESLVEICNVCACPGWFCIPFAASDDYVTQFANYLKANYTQSVVYIEYANEVWNSAYSFVFNWVRARGLAAFSGIGGAALDGFYGYRMAQIAAIMRPILGGKLQMVLANQGSAGVPGLALGGSCTISGSVLTVGGTVDTSHGTFAVGNLLFNQGPGIQIPSNVSIASLGTGTGGSGTYNLSGPAPTISVGQGILCMPTTTNMSTIENQRFQNNSFPQLSGANAPINSADVVSYAMYYGSCTMGGVTTDALWSPRPGSDISGLFTAVQNYQAMSYASAFAWAANDILSGLNYFANASNGSNQNTRFGNWNALAKKYGKKVILYEQNHEIASPSQIYGYTTSPFNNLVGFTAIVNPGIAAGSTSQRVAIPAGVTQLVLYNGQAQSAFFKLGDGTVVASSGNNDGTLASVGYFAINVGANTFIAIIANGTPDSTLNRRVHIFGCQLTSFTNGANGAPYPSDATGNVYAFSGNPQPPSNGNGEYPLPVIGGTSLNFPLPAGTSCVIYNSDPTTTVHIKLGADNTVTALTSDTAVAPGTGKSFTINANTWLAAITTGALAQIIIEGGTGGIADGTVVNNTYGGAGGILDNFLFGSDGFMSSSQYKTVVSNYLGAFYSLSQSFGSSILGMCTASPWLTFPPISLSTTATTGQGLSSLTPYSNWTAHQTWNNSNSC